MKHFRIVNLDGERNAVSCACWCRPTQALLHNRFISIPVHSFYALVNSTLFVPSTARLSLTFVHHSTRCQWERSSHRHILPFSN